MSIRDKISGRNKAIKMYSRKAKEYNEIKEIEIGIDIIYE